MEKVKYVSYSDWISLISEIMRKGLACEELNTFQDVYPQSVGESYDVMIYNELARLEQYMIRETVNIFQKQMTSCLNEIDLEIAESAFIRLKKHYVSCMFFLQIPDYPESVKSKMSEEVKKNMQSFIDSFLKYLKKLEYEHNSTFIQDYVYVCKKNLKKIEKMY